MIRPSSPRPSQPLHIGEEKRHNPRRRQTRTVPPADALPRSIGGLSAAEDDTAAATSPSAIVLRPWKTSSGRCWARTSDRQFVVCLWSERPVVFRLLRASVR
jgi:hypothetical protein